MRTSTRILIDKIGIALSLILLVVALVGEILGWWGELGIVLTIFATAVGLLSLLDLNGRDLLERFGHQEAKMDRMLTTQSEMLGKQDQMLGKQDQMLGKQDQMLGKQDATIGVLERIERILDDRLPGA